jgi:hypothetical protein
MLISDTHRFVFFHIGKTGGMSVRRALQEYAREPERFKIRRPARLVHGRPNPMYEVWSTLLLHATARDALKELPPEQFSRYFKFAFVRNPWDLHVSLYHFILREPTSSTYAQVASLGSFDAFLEWAIATPHLFPKGITKWQHEMIADEQGVLLVDFVGRYESLDRDFTHVCRTLGISAVLPHLNRSEHRDYRAYYTPRTRGLLARHCGADIEMFGYSF